MRSKPALQNGGEVERSSERRVKRRIERRGDRRGEGRLGEGEVGQGEGGQTPVRFSPREGVSIASEKEKRIPSCEVSSVFASLKHVVTQ